MTTEDEWQKEDLLSELFVVRDESWISIILKNYVHLDYIDDVLTEHFDIVVGSLTVDDENKKYILHFDANAWDEVTSAINQINAYHKKHGGFYDTI